MTYANWENMGYGWYYFHHHHIHVSFNQPSYNKPGATGAADDCMVPGCLDKPLVDFLGRYGLTNAKAAPARIRAKGLVPVKLAR